MADTGSRLRFSVTSVGGLGLVTGVVCCLGLKLLGGSILLGGLATMVGLTTDQITFVVGGFTGLTLGLLLLGVHRYHRHDSDT